MTQDPCLASDLPINVPERTSAVLPVSEVAGHDEWLLDEALAETFPASDPVAVTAHWRRPAQQPQVHKAGAPEPSQDRNPATGGISDCAIGNDEASKTEVLATPLCCDHCHSEIPATVAFNFEGADYVYHFCGEQCLVTWCKAAHT